METKEETAIVPAEAAPIVKEETPDDLFVFARNPQEMGQEQARMVAWATKRLELKKEEVDEAKANLAIAKKRKWKTSTFQAIVSKAEKKYEFYEKMKKALEEGYYIIPDMDVQLFAVRTTRKNPKRNDHYGNWGTPKDQESSRPPAGEGRYVDVQAFTDSKDQLVKHDVGKNPEYRRQTWATEFDEEVDFPFKMAKPSVLNAAAAAMGLKVFDEIGILPRTRGADPMIVGRVTYKEGYNTKRINFLIAWFIDTKEL
jgi:hypothetical protein